jgi:hypothetical protein
MTPHPIDRRRFLTQAAGVGAAALTVGCHRPQRHPPAPFIAGPDAPAPAPTRPYPRRRPNVILVRFGGGVRRQETILDASRTYCPFLYHELYERQGVLFNNVRIDPTLQIDTSHGQGTLYLLTGAYDHYEDISRQPFADRFESQRPTVFEYFRRRYAVPEYQALIVNGEDRINEEFYTFSNHHLYGVRYRSTVLSLYRFKTFLLREDLRDPNLSDAERATKERELQQMESRDYRVLDAHVESPQLDAFWRDWRAYYGRTGLVNPRGDRLLTELSIRALRQLRPWLLMINYQDPDYVHWGNPNFYTRAISIIDEGVRQIYEAVQSDPGDGHGHTYRDNTVFLIVPDCGRDNNRCMAVPFQHHFNSRSAHEVFVIAAGPGIARSRRPVDVQHEQCSVAATVGRLMDFPTPHVEQAAGPLGEMFA